MDSLCGFPFDKPRIGNIDTYNKHKYKQETHIKSLCGKAASTHTSQGLDILADCVCGVRYKIQLVCLLYHIPCGIGDIHTHCPDKICDGIESVLDRLADTVKPVPRQPVP